MIPGITFLDDGVIDLDVTCYINDAYEKNKKVGYGNGYTKTTYISWSGDETNGGSETFLIDVNKYFNDFNLSDNDLYVDFDVCYHQNSQIIPENTYILVNWLGLEEKFELKTYGINDHACNTKSFAVKINRKTKTFEIIYYSLYPVLKVNFDSVISNTNFNIPNIELGLINVSENFDSFLNKKGNWTQSNIESIYYTNDSEENSLSLLLLDDQYKILINDDINVIKMYESVLDDWIFLRNRNKIIKAEELKLMKGYFGINMNNLNKFNVNMNYVFYLNKKYFRDVEDSVALSSVFQFISLNELNRKGEE